MNWFTWLRYWFLDSADLITLMLIDKGYYDYDFNQEAIDKGKGRKKVDKVTREAAWKRMGFGTLRRPGEDKKRLTAEEAQRIAMAEIKEQHENKLQI